MDCYANQAARRKQLEDLELREREARLSSVREALGKRFPDVAWVADESKYDEQVTGAAGHVGIEVHLQSGRVSISACRGDEEDDARPALVVERKFESFDGIPEAVGLLATELQTAVRALSEAGILAQEPPDASPVPTAPVERRSRGAKGRRP
jgi:hypothetical protein